MNQKCPLCSFFSFFFNSQCITSCNAAIKHSDVFACHFKFALCIWHISCQENISFRNKKKMLNFNIIIISFSEFHKHKMENVSLFHIFVWQTTHFSRIFFSMSSYKEEEEKNTFLFRYDTIFLMIHFPNISQIELSFSSS